MSTDPHKRWADGGMKSRKFLFALFAVGVLALGFVYADTHASAKSLYETFVNGVEAISAAYIVGNLGGKWVAGKSEAPVAPQTPPKTVVKELKKEDELPPP